MQAEGEWEGLCACLIQAAFLQAEGQWEGLCACLLQAAFLQSCSGHRICVRLCSAARKHKGTTQLQPKLSRSTLLASTNLWHINQLHFVKSTSLIFRTSLILPALFCRFYQPYFSNQPYSTSLIFSTSLILPQSHFKPTSLIFYAGSSK